MKKKFIIILLLMLMGVCPAGCGSAQEYISEQLERGVEDKGQNVSENDAAVTVPEKPEVFVHISGAVKKPGVYSLSDGSRLFDAVSLAGGFTDEADEDFLNLAGTIEDGQKYHVPTKEETKGMDQPAAAAVSDGRIDINHAGVDELMQLSGIGEGKARAIVAYREEHGAFAKIEDIKNVTGIGENTYAGFKDDITAR